MFIRTESFRGFLRLYPVVSAIVAIHLVIFLIMYLFWSFGGNYIFAFGVGNNLAIANGQWWRLITPIFMHQAPAHFIFNSFSLILFGPALERLLGKIRFTTVYIATGIIANIATFYFGGFGYSYHLGASGAIFGLFGIYTYMVIQRKDLIDQSNSQIVITILLIGLVMTFINQNINIYAHIFGVIAGMALAPLFLFNIKR